jgi:hypothetical protein
VHLEFERDANKTLLTPGSAAGARKVRGRQRRKLNYAPGRLLCVCAGEGDDAVGSEEKKSGR